MCCESGTKKGVKWLRDESRLLSLLATPIIESTHPFSQLPCQSRDENRLLPNRRNGLFYSSKRDCVLRAGSSSFGSIGGGICFLSQSKMFCTPLNGEASKSPERLSRENCNLFSHI